MSGPKDPDMAITEDLEVVEFSQPRDPPVSKQPVEVAITSSSANADIDEDARQRGLPQDNLGHTILRRPRRKPVDLGYYADLWGREAVETLVRLMMDEEQSPRLRREAAKDLLQEIRAYKLPQPQGETKKTSAESALLEVVKEFAKAKKVK